MPPKIFFPQEKNQEVDQWLKNFDKESAQAAEDGNTVDAAAEEMSQGLFAWICKHSLGMDHSLMHAWTTMQWNCVCRSKNVVTLGFHSITVVNDALCFKFDKTKTKNKSEDISPKHVYANPLNPYVYFNWYLKCVIIQP